VMWNMWFVLMIEILYNWQEISAFGDMGHMFSSTLERLTNWGLFTDHLRYFNERGTWSLNSSQWYGLILSAVWAGEFLVIIAFPLIAAYASAGLFLNELNAWVKEKLMNYGFAAFDDHELDRLASGDIDVILQKPLETHGGPMNAVAVCYHKGEPTEFIALYKAGWDNEGALSKGRHIMTVRLGVEKIDALDAGLQAIHYPVAAEKNVPNDTPNTIATADPVEPTIAETKPQNEVIEPAAPDVDGE